jgi:hypothetical protein
MKIELYHYEIVWALQKHINERLGIELDFDDFKGDRDTVINLVSNPDCGEVDHHQFREGDSIIFYLN